ncbi:hypothetical protein F5B17DRAFT_120193 [Nemania serpens]|nr:hypothetical protein F5B17DRAFT_120193 [Nemania serpens]
MRNASYTTGLIRNHAPDNEFKSIATVLSTNCAQTRELGLHQSNELRLQVHAINILNSKRFGIDETSCSAALLFSALDRHMLATRYRLQTRTALYS